jgi:hypothetical protein
MLFRLLHSAFISGLRAKLSDRSQIDPPGEMPEAEDPRPRSRRRRA